MASISLARPQSGGSSVKMDYEVPYFGQLDTTTDPSGMSELDSPDTLNTVYDSINAVMSRKGYSKVLTTPTPSFIGGMWPLYQSTGVKQLIYASGTNLYKYNNAGGSTVITGTPSSFTANRYWSFDQLLDSAYGGNGIDGLIAYNGASCSIANSAVQAQFVLQRKNRLYIANPNSSLVYYSDAGNPTSFPVNNFMNIGINDGQNITGLGISGDNLVVFKDTNTYIITGEPLGAGNLVTVGNLSLRQISSNVGCCSFRTVCNVNGTLFFANASGIYYVQNYSVYLLTPLLNSTFKNGINTNFMNLCWAIYNDLEKKYIFGYPSATATTCDSALVFDILTKKWTHWDHLPGSCAINYRFSGLRETILTGDPNKGNIYELLQGNADIAGDNGTSSGGSSTTLVDVTKSWTTNMFTDCRVAIVASPGVLIPVGTVTSNTATTLTFASTSFTPSAGQQYTIGYYDSYWTTKNFDFKMTGYVKKYRFFNLFCDSELYSILFGSAVDYAPLNYQKAFNLSSGALVYGALGLRWGPSSGVWGSYSAEFAQGNIAATGRYIAIKFGNNLANQPWRAIHYSISYKSKKMRPNIVTT